MNNFALLQPPTSFYKLMGEPGRPVWPSWELLKRMVGKSDHTVAAIGEVETVWPVSVDIRAEMRKMCRDQK